MIKITDPAKTLERCQARINELEALNRDDPLSARIPTIAAMRRRQISALRATITRVARQYLGAS